MKQINSKNWSRSGLDRREFLERSLLGGMAIAGWPAAASLLGADAAPRKSSARIAAIITEYRPLSHADVILSRLLEDFILDVQTYYSPVRLHSMYVDQFPERDMARWVSKAYGPRISDTIAGAILDEKGKLAVDGVWIIGEHGNYPHNERGQHLYPRRRFFEGVVEAFKQAGAVVPVFNDKHLAARWEDALWMYQTAQAMNIPLMAGSSLPLTWRRPRLELPLETPLEEALAIGYSSIEAYGFHALETLQCMAERRAGGETGVVSVQCLEGDAVWEAGRQGRWSRALLDAAVDRLSRRPSGDIEKLAQNPTAYLLEYKDGFRGSVLMLDGVSAEFSFAAKLQDQARPVSTLFWLQEPGFGHFSYLSRAISEFVLTGKPVYPAERTLLTTGVLCRAMDSRFEGHRRIPTPELAISYRGVDHGLGAYARPDDPDGRSGGWVVLFDGKSLGNWRERAAAGAGAGAGAEGKAGEKAGEPRWEVADGILRGSGGQGYLAGFEEFADLELFAECRVRAAAGEDASKAGRGCIQVRCQPPAGKGAAPPPGYRVELEPAGSILASENRLENAPAGGGAAGKAGWFTLRILAQGPRLRSWVDGEPAADWTDPQARHRSGAILLGRDASPGKIEIRELRIRRL